MLPTAQIVLSTPTNNKEGSMRIKQLGLGVLSALSAVILLGINGGKASAHYVYNSGHMYYSNQDCVWGYSEVSHGNGNGYSKSEIRAQFRGGDSNCIESFYRPSGYLKVRQIFQAQLAPGWGYCRDTGWIYNTSNVTSMTVARTHSGKCGTTNYRTESQMYMLNGSWKGGTITSGNHWL